VAEPERISEPVAPVDVPAQLPAPPLGANAAIASAMGNAAFARFAGVTATPRAPAPPAPPAPGTPVGPVLARKKGPGKTTAGISVSPQFSASGAKLTVEGGFMYEKGVSYVSIGGGASVTGEIEAKWSQAGGGPSGGPKGSKSTGGESAKSVEGELPIWKSATEKALEKDAKASFEDHFTPIEASLVFGGERGASKPEKTTSTAAAVGVKMKMKTGDEATVKVQLFNAKAGEGAVVDIEGPKFSGEYEFIHQFDDRVIHTTKDGTPITVGGKVSVKPAITIKPDYVAIGAKVAESVIGRVASAAAPVAIPLAAAVAIGYGLYVGARNADAARRAAGDGVKAREDAKQACQSYARVLTTGQPGGGDIGAEYGLKDYKAIEAEALGVLTTEEIVAKIKETKGGPGKIAADNLQRMKDAMYEKAVAEYEAANKEDFSWWEELGEDWGRRGVYRKTLKLVLYGD
jgi:hypothetical protein